MKIIKQGLVDLAMNQGSRRVRRSKGRSALIIPPAGPGSVGDAAMLTSLIRALRLRGAEEVNILQVERGACWNLDNPQDRFILGADFIDYGSRLNLASILLELGNHTDIFCIGADILDGIYDETKMANRLELIGLAAKMGLNATIVGSSFSEHPTRRCVELLRALPQSVKIFARDEYSLSRMLANLDRPIGLSADVAFLLEPEPQAIRELPQRLWVEAQRDLGRPIIAINANNLHEERHPTLIDDYTRLAGKLIELGCSLLLVPHDSRTERSDQFIADRIHAGLGATGARHAEVFRPTTPGQLKALLAQVDLIVTGRMHAAIIALGGSTPAMSFAYANKFEGLYRHLELDPEEMILSLADLRDKPDDVTGSIVGVLARVVQLRQHISNRISTLKRAAELNLGDELPTAA